MVDLGTRYLGLRLRSPLVASSSPLTGRVETLRQLEDAGAAAVVLPSLFEEELTSHSLAVDRLLETGAGSFGEALDYFPQLEDYDAGPGRYLELVRHAKQALSIPVIGSLNGTTPGGWLEHAKLLQQAGADALELNLYHVAADPDESAASVERRLREVVAAVRREVSIPVAVKLSPFFTALAHTARELVGAGADGLVLFNRFTQPDLDLDALEVVPHLALSTSQEARLPMRWIALLRGRLRASLAATSGVHSPEDVLKLLLAGADAVMLASALLEQGPRHLRALEQGLTTWMTEREYASVEQLRGSMSQGAVADPSAFERAHYVRTLRWGREAYRR